MVRDTIDAPGLPTVAARTREPSAIVFASMRIVDKLEPAGDDCAVLLGAGASVKAGVPSSRDMTKELLRSIDHDSAPHEAQALHYVCAALTAYDMGRGAPADEGLDAERVFAAVELLAERRTLEVSSFVSAWHPAVDIWDRPALPVGWDLRLRELLARQSPDDHARDLVLELVRSEAGEGSGDIYTALSRRLVGALRRLTDVKKQQTAYLLPLVRAAASRKGGLTIGTLNYDLAVEKACDMAGVDVETGIERWAVERTWPDWGADVAESKRPRVNLLKLHGSISWCWQPTVGGAPSPRKVAVTHDPREDDRDPVVVFGLRRKLRPEGPFLSLLAQFEKQLANATELVVIGYSFRDEHVNEVIHHWASKADRTIKVVDPGWPKLLFATDFRRTLDAELADRLICIRAKAKKGLKQLFG